MLNNPPINSLEDKAGCRYLLVSAVARRARRIMEENPPHNVKNNDKEVRMPGIPDNEALDKAVDEFYAGKYGIRNDD